MRSLGEVEQGRRLRRLRYLRSDKRFYHRPHSMAAITVDIHDNHKGTRPDIGLIDSSSSLENCNSSTGVVLCNIKVISLVTHPVGRRLCQRE
jgi:hypothetical protein